jgi:hypothetical protein
MSLMGDIRTAIKELLAWIIEVAEGTVVWVGTSKATEDILAAPNGTKRTVNPADMHELVALGLLRHMEVDRYAVTSSGQDVYKQIKNPPQKRSPAGFQHS